MDLMSIDDVTYRPTDVVDGYSDLIWTERFYEPGDFELKTPYVERTMNQLPIDSMCCLSDREEVMIVETHEMEENDDGEEILTVKGRSFDSFLEQRLAVDEDYPFINEFDRTGKNLGIHGWKLTNSNWNAADAAAYAITTKLVTGQQSDIDVETLFLSCKIDNFVVWNFYTEGRGNFSYMMERTQLNEEILKLIKSVGCGIRTARPSSGETLLRMVIYPGVNRSWSQTSNVRIVFDNALGHLNNAKYLRSNRDYKILFFIYPANQRGGSPMPGNPDVTWVPRWIRGRKRRDLYIEATEITSEYAADVWPALATRRAIAPSQYPKTDLVSTKISPNTPFKLGTDYNLGDIVTVSGKYGIIKDMRVTEYIRSESSAGEVGYPTVSEI